MSQDDEDLTVRERVMQVALRLDRKRTQAFIKTLRGRRSGEGRGQLADRLIRRARWWAAGWGVATGLPANPWVAFPAAVTDAGAVLRVEVDLAARIALLYDPLFLDDGEPPYELLVPIFGARAGSEFLREMSIRGTMGVTRAIIRKQLSKQTLTVFKRIMLKYFGLKVTQRAAVKATLPIVGGVVGGTWNYREVSTVGERVKRYFEEQQLDEPGGAA